MMRNKISFPVKNEKMVSQMEFGSTQYENAKKIKKELKDKTRKNLPKFVLSSQQKIDLKEAFDLFDSEGTGLVERDYLKVAFRALGIEPSAIDLRNLGQLPKFISYPEFVEQLQLKMTSADELSDIIKMFELFDCDKSGRIMYDEMRKVCQILGEDVTDEEIDVMLQAGDVTGEKKVEFKEFKKLMESLMKA
ncbi:hypothetical protein WA026_013082 [Henosepilachna vigintioctopunctata]|uniref:EF-hand domain-containing protein n=1 Tax=Henosepilachna vigintioctopunctata TaxID=420089 RepID=A0AAW1UL23_9CUCU